MGREVELTRELLELHKRLRSEGVPIEECCRIAGHGVSVWYRWKRLGEEQVLIDEMGKLGLFDEDTWSPEPAHTEPAV